MPLLELKGLTRYFGGLAAVSDLDILVEKGEILGLIGPNGAGKSTVFNCISGVYKPSRGRVFFKGEDITGLRPDQIARKGLVRTFQATTLFQHFPALVNVLVGCHLHSPLRSPGGFFGTVFPTAGAQRREHAALQKATTLLSFMGIDHLAGELALNLPHGHQRALGVAVALASDPDVVMLDEPVTGMNPEETVRMMGHIRQIRDRGTTVLLVEHDMRAVMGVCDRIVVLNFGRKIAEGTPREIRESPEVIEAYLGTDYAA